MNGTSQIGVINQHIKATHQKLDEIHQRLEAAIQQSADVRRQLTEAYRKLAGFRLKELAADQVRTQLDETDRTVLKLLERRSQELKKLDSAIEDTAARQEQLTAQRERLVRRRDDLVNQVDDRAAEIKLRLGRKSEYILQELKVEEAAKRAKQAEKKAAQAETDQDEKGKPYREDPLFMYLWNRRFQTPDYTGGMLTRRLDGWVARLINYPDARSNYYMLTELPVRLRKHADRQKAMADETLDALHTMEDKSLQDEGIINDKKQLQATQKSLEKIEDRIDILEEEHETLLQERLAYSTASDETSQQALNLHLSSIRHKSLEALYNEAKTTNKPEDDIIVAQIRDLQEKEQRLNAEIKKLELEEKQQQSAYRELETLRRRFRQSSYDSTYSSFPKGLELGALLGTLLNGRTSGRDVWDHIDREQQFRRPRTPGNFGGGLFPGSFGGGFPKGGGGSMGSGGFRTGGGF